MFSNLKDKIKEYFFGKEYHWQYTYLTITYDLTKHPEVSKNSPIKEMNMSYYFRYCPKNKILQRKNVYMSKSEFSDVEISHYIRHEHISEFINGTDLSYKRQYKLNKLIK